jgi:spore coat polysaccharide biosynthesis protein SpsF (cytidylyltransferase family)
MKQHITSKDLNQLSEKGKEKLKMWYFNREGYMLTREQQEVAFKYEKELKRTYLPVESDINIGTMIEFLDDNTDLEAENNSREKEITWKKNEELADALWSACKEFLDE